MNYEVHNFPVRMPKDQNQPENFLISLSGEVVAIIPNLAPVPFTWHEKLDFLLVVEKLV